jgi:ferrous iron transport protein B
LTGAYAVVSNYPGTTVEISQGKARIGDEEWEVADTPGMCSLLPNSEEERVARGGALLLQGDAEMRGRLSTAAAAAVDAAVAHCQRGHSKPLRCLIATERQRQAFYLAARVMKFAPKGLQPFAERLSAVLINPWTGFPILLLVLYVGLYKFVGQLGAGAAVDFLERYYINPAVDALCGRYVPWSPVRDLLAGEYGVITLGCDTASPSSSRLSDSSSCFSRSWRTPAT